MVESCNLLSLQKKTAWIFNLVTSLTQHRGVKYNIKWPGEEFKFFQNYSSILASWLFHISKLESPYQFYQKNFVGIFIGFVLKWKILFSSENTFIEYQVGWGYRPWQ